MHIQDVYVYTCIRNKSTHEKGGENMNGNTTLYVSVVETEVGSKPIGLFLTYSEASDCCEKSGYCCVVKEI